MAANSRTNFNDFGTSKDNVVPTRGFIVSNCRKSLSANTRDDTSVNHYSVDCSSIWQRFSSLEIAPREQTASNNFANSASKPDLNSSFLTNFRDLWPVRPEDSRNFQQPPLNSDSSDPDYSDYMWQHRVWGPNNTSDFLRGEGAAKPLFNEQEKAAAKKGVSGQSSQSFASSKPGTSDDSSYLQYLLFDSQEYSELTAKEKLYKMCLDPFFDADSIEQSVSQKLEERKRFNNRQNPSRNRKYCKFCKNNNEEDIYHDFKNARGEVVCPILSKHVCDLCGQSGKFAHTRKYCPRNPVTRGTPEESGFPPGMLPKEVMENTLIMLKVVENSNK